MVSDGALDELLANLQYPPTKESLRGVTVSPDTITRFIRMIIFPLAVEVAESVLRALHELLHGIALSKDVSAAKTDMAFCLSYTLLVFLANTQSRILLVSGLPEHEKGMAMSGDQAFETIRDMENELATYIIHFHEFAIKRPKTVTASSRSADECERHAADFGLMKEVERLTLEYSGYYRPAQRYSTELPLEETRPPNLRLRRPDIKKFDVENVHRLCWKFIDAIGIGQSG